MLSDFFHSEESNFHVFYYLYDGLTNKNLHRDYYLDSELRLLHTYLTADRQDPATKKVRLSCLSCYMGEIIF